jgi:hypothetical protein
MRKKKKTKKKIKLFSTSIKKNFVNCHQERFQTPNTKLQNVKVGNTSFNNMKGKHNDNNIAKGNNNAKQSNGNNNNSNNTKKNMKTKV